MADARRTLESAANFTRGGGAPAPDHDAAHARRTRRVEAEQQRLIQWAKENWKLGGRLPPEFTRGGEHQVYFHKGKQRYFKATLLERQLGYGIALVLTLAAQPRPNISTGWICKTRFLTMTSGWSVLCLKMANPSSSPRNHSSKASPQARWRWTS
jgi:hypothetical protein